MRVILAKTAGFCYGVERAVALAHETAKAHGGAMLGSVIHNANVVAELEHEGMRLIASPEEAAAGETVLIRSHGESREVLEELQARGAEIVSATCPNVRHIQILVTEAEAAAYRGDAAHLPLAEVAEDTPCGLYWCLAGAETEPYAVPRAS